MEATTFRIGIGVKVLNLVVLNSYSLLSLKTTIVVVDTKGANEVELLRVPMRQFAGLNTTFPNFAKKNNAGEGVSMAVATILITLGAFGLSEVRAQQKGNVMNDLKERAKMTCKLTTPELQERKRTVIAELKSVVKERQEETNAVRYKFESADKDIDLVSNFIKTERLCCDFFEFSLRVESSSNFMWLKLSGPDGVKDFIQEEIGF